VRPPVNPLSFSAPHLKQLFLSNPGTELRAIVVLLSVLGS